MNRERSSRWILVGHQPRRVLCSLLGVLQVLTVLVSVQLSGVVHFVRDLVQVVSVGEHHHDDSDDDDAAGHECPPGCPNCHHAHQSGASLSRSAAATDFVPPREASLRLGCDGDDEGPPGPPLPSVYRPPRA